MDEYAPQLTSAFLNTLNEYKKKMEYTPKIDVIVDIIGIESKKLYLKLTPNCYKALKENITNYMFVKIALDEIYKSLLEKLHNTRKKIIVRSINLSEDNFLVCEYYDDYLSGVTIEWT